MNVKVILQVAYMSAFRPSFSLNGSFARVFKIFSHRRTDTHTHGTDHSTPAQARGNNTESDQENYVPIYCHKLYAYTRIHVRLKSKVFNIHVHVTRRWYVN